MGSWPVQVLLVPLLLVVPGVICCGRCGFRVSRSPPSGLCARRVTAGAGRFGSGCRYGRSAGASIGAVAAVPLLVGLELVCGALLACSVNAPAETEIPWGSLPRPARLAWPLLLPLVAAAGALRLNSGHGNQVAVLAVIMVVVVLVAGFLFAPWLDVPLLAMIHFRGGAGDDVVVFACAGIPCMGSTFLLSIIRCTRRW